MKKISFIILLAFYMSQSLFAQKIVGNWEGNIEVNGIEVPIVFHFTKSSEAKIEGKWDSPKQKAMGLPFSMISNDEDSLHLDIKMISGTYEGKFIGNDSITGIWTQNNHQLPLNFSRTSVSNETKEVATPLSPGEKEIAITSAAGSKLYGTLLSKNNQQPIAVIFAGSGPTDRDGNSSIGAPTNDYQMLAHDLDSQNIATFRFDKRGVAKSIPSDFNESNLVFDDYVKDAEKIFNYLHDTLGFKNIYFIGHSEGSLIAMLASQKKKVKGYISIAGAGRPIDEILEEQLQKAPWPDSVKQQITPNFNQLKKGHLVNTFPSQLEIVFRKSVQPYMISWLKYSPQQEIKKLNCPILILQGGCDIQVKEIDATNLHEANKKSTLDIIPTMTHTLKNAGKDCVDEQKTYTDGSMPLDETLVKDIVGFIKK
ncbi:MAG: alpha/beta fold hydrolase [Ginsengibacter sp.]